MWPEASLGAPVMEGWGIRAEQPWYDEEEQFRDPLSIRQEGQSSAGLGVGGSVLRSQLLCLLAQLPWARDFTSLSLSFLTPLG